MITLKEVQHIAKLARLGITEAEAEKLRKDLSSVLDYAEKLKKVDVSKIEPTANPLKIENVTRSDSEKPKIENQNSKLLELAPEIKEGYIKVKSILK